MTRGKKSNWGSPVLKYKSIWLKYCVSLSPLEGERFAFESVWDPEDVIAAPVPTPSHCTVPRTTVIYGSRYHLKR